MPLGPAIFLPFNPAIELTPFLAPTMAKVSVGRETPAMIITGLPSLLDIKTEEVFITPAISRSPLASA